jgi:hypothetical protein
VAGAAIQWLRDGLGLIGRADETEALARSVADTGGVHFVPAFVGLGSPHWEAEARGTLTGLTRGTTRAHIVRAALEAMAFSSAELLAAMAGAEVVGPRAASGWRRRRQRLDDAVSAVLGIPVERPDMVERPRSAPRTRQAGGRGMGRHRRVLAGRQFTRFEPRMDEAERLGGGLTGTAPSPPRLGPHLAGPDPPLSPERSEAYEHAPRCALGDSACGGEDSRGRARRRPARAFNQGQLEVGEAGRAVGRPQKSIPGGAGS